MQSRPGEVLAYLHQLLAPTALRASPDSELLSAFAERRDQPAFAALVARHGAMVFNVCRRVVGNSHTAEDAYQATFMVLAKKAPSLRPGSPLAPWLYGVAYKVALNARRAGKRQPAAQLIRNGASIVDPHQDPLAGLSANELLTIIEDEISRLPTQFRVVLALCCLDGLSVEEAARRLGLAEGAVKGRLERGRAKLHARLVRRGLSLSAALGVLEAAGGSLWAAPGTVLAVQALQASLAFVGSQQITLAVISTEALALAQQSLKGIAMVKLKLFLMIFAATITLGGVGVAGYRGLGKLDDGGELLPNKTIVQAIQEPPEQVAKAPQVKAEQPRLDIKGDPLPPGAVTRLGSRRWLQGYASFAAFLPDGKNVVTLDLDRNIRLWDFPSGTEIRRIVLGSSNKAVFSNDLYQLLTKDDVYVALTNNGKTMATYYPKELEVRFHDIATGKQLPGIKTSDEVLAMAFSPDGRYLASTNEAGVIRIWDWAKSKETQSIATSGPNSSSDKSGKINLPSRLGKRIEMAYAPDGKAIVISRLELDKTPTLKLLDAATGTQLCAIPLEKKSGRASSPTFSPDGKTLAYKTAKTITLVETATGKELGKPFIHEHIHAGTTELTTGPSLVFGKDAAKLYVFTSSLDEGPVIMEWNIATSTLLRESPRLRSAISEGQLSLSPDGNTLVLSSRGPTFIDINAKELSVSPIGPAMPLVSLQFMPDGKNLLTTRSQEVWNLTVQQRNLSVEKWEPITGKNLGLASLPMPLHPINISRDGKLIAGYQLDSKAVILVDAASGTELSRIAIEAPDPKLSLCLSPDGNTLAIRQSGKLDDAKYGKVEVYDVQTGKLRHTLAVKSIDFLGAPTATVFSTNGKSLVSAADKNTMGIWDVMSGQRVGSLPWPTDFVLRTFAPECTAVFSPDGRCLALDTSDNDVALYELASAQPRRTFGAKKPPAKFIGGKNFPISINEPSSCFSISPDGTSLVQAGNDGIVHLWDIKTGLETATFNGHTAPVNAVAFTFDGKMVASAGADGTALIWDLSKIERPLLPIKTLQASDLENCWMALGETDAAKAWTSICDLVAASNDTMPFLSSRLKPSTPLDTKHTVELIKQLDAEQYKIRENAVAELLKIGERIVPALDKALDAKPSVQARQSLEKLRSELTDKIFRGDRLRMVRAIEILELIGTPVARQVLQTLADGAPDTLVTTSARQALKRKWPG